MWKVLRHGRDYMKIWPNHAIVGNLPEARFIPATRWGVRLLPGAAIANFFVQFQYLGADYLIQIIAASLFLLALPIQGYYWLGKRAYSMLPPALNGWYFELKTKLNESGEDIRLPSHRKGPCFIDLARVLRKALAVLPPEEQ